MWFNYTLIDCEQTIRIFDLEMVVDTLIIILGEQVIGY